MSSTYSYKQIFNISFPIMIGSAAQQVITLSDGIFLYPRGEQDFAAIGFVGVFYLIIAAVGYGFSKGGQIMIARRIGEDKPEEVGSNFRAMFSFELLLACIFFLFMYYGCPYFFMLMLDSDIVYTKSLEYLEYRSWGVFFSYTGMAFIALYTGIARTWFIIVDTVILGAVNIFLNYALINGYYGLPEMGIAGAGLASTIAEIVAFALFILYVFIDKQIKPYKLFSKAKPSFELIQTQARLALPMVAQSVVGIGSWLIFFGLIENYGERELAKANLVRYVYLFLSVPVWGYCSGINTMTSNAIGNGQPDFIFPIAKKTWILCFITTLVISLPVFLFPEFLLSYIFQYGEGMADTSLLRESVPLMYILIGVLLAYITYSIYFNALAGTGATLQGLFIQCVCLVFYIGYAFTSIKILEAPQIWAWAGEIFYGFLMFAIIYAYLKKGNWRNIRV